ncbi:hypothetical protein ABI59_12360 [Acidobacteria bacterium Mor1]|nr:hypothetical protein ABI59_12360 [Acidobacteria bacterium Mor1]
MSRTAADLALLMLLACTTHSAQTTVEVRVHDATDGERLPGVRIELAMNGDIKECFVGAEGLCGWQGIRAGSYTLRASMAGFQTQERTIDLVAGSNKLDLDLEPYRVVSLIELLGSPEDFDGLPVVIEGFCSNVFEDQALYLDREHWRQGLNSNSLRLDADPSILRDRHHKRYVTVRGVFAAPRPVDLRSGRVHSIAQVSLNERRR